MTMLHSNVTYTELASVSNSIFHSEKITVPANAAKSALYEIRVSKASLRFFSFMKKLDKSVDLLR